MVGRTMQSKNRLVTAGIAMALLAALAAVPSPAFAQTTPATELAVVLTQTGGSTKVTEGSAATDTYTIALNRAPNGPITVELTFAAAHAPDLTLSTTSVAFAPNDVAPKPVTVAAGTDDALAEGTEQVVVTHTTKSSVVPEDGKTATLTVLVSDNDAGIGITHTGGATSVTERRTGTNPTPTDTIHVTLGKAPTKPVTLTLTPNAQIHRDTATLVFTSGDWNIPRPVVVESIDDKIDDDPLNGQLQVTASSTDLSYHGMATTFTVTVVDDDVAGYVFDGQTTNLGALPAANSIQVSESGTTDSYTLRLNSEPLTDVVVTFGHGGELQPTPDATFTPANWMTPQSIVIRAVDDDVDEGSAATHDAPIIHTVASTDPKYGPGTINGAALVAKVTDNDQVAVLFTATGTGTVVQETAEPGAGTDTVEVRLQTQPTSTVTVTITGSPDGQVTLTPPSLTFSPTDWKTPKTVTVAAVNDNNAESAAQRSITLTADSGAYAATDPTLTITVLDDEGVGHVSVVGPLVVREGPAGAGYTISLVQKPTSPVTVTLAPSTDQFLVNGQTTATLTFDVLSDCTVHGNGVATLGPIVDNTLIPLVDGALTTLDTLLPLGIGGAVDQAQACNLWDEPQTVTVSAAKDGLFEGTDDAGFITHDVDSQDAFYKDAKIKAVPVTILDGDKGLLFKPASLAITEGQSAVYTVELTAEPEFGLGVELAAPAGLTLSETTLYFSPADWDQGQAVTVATAGNSEDGSDRTLSIGHTVFGTPESGFAGRTASFQVEVVDDDTAGVIVYVNGGTHVTEGGPKDFYSIRLQSQPTDPVVITIAADGELLVPLAEVTFTPSDWHIPRYVNVFAANDADVEGDHTGTITHTVASDDDLYDGIAADDVTVDITDND